MRRRKGQIREDISLTQRALRQGMGGASFRDLGDLSAPTPQRVRTGRFRPNTGDDLPRHLVSNVPAIEGAK